MVVRRGVDRRYGFAVPIVKRKRFGRVNGERRRRVTVILNGRRRKIIAVLIIRRIFRLIAGKSGKK